jgi:hypothetical protein
MCAVFSRPARFVAPERRSFLALGLLKLLLEEGWPREILEVDIGLEKVDELEVEAQIPNKRALANPAGPEEEVASLKIKVQSPFQHVYFRIV